MMASNSYLTMNVFIALVFLQRSLNVNGAPAGQFNGEADCKHMVETSLNMSIVDQPHITERPHRIDPAGSSNKDDLFKLAASVCFNVFLLNVTKVSKIDLSSGKGQKRDVTVTVHPPEEESTHIEKVVIDDSQLHTILHINPPRQISSLLISISLPSVLSLHVWSCEDQSRDSEQETPRIALEQVSSGCLGDHHKTVESKSNGGGNVSKNNMKSFEQMKRLFVKRASSLDDPDTSGSYSLTQFIIVGVFLSVLPMILVGFLCCNKMGSSSAKLDKKMIIDEASPFHSKNNPMNARANSVRSIKREDKRDSCSKTDSIYRDSFHPLGSPTVSTFGVLDSSDAESVKTLTANSHQSIMSNVLSAQSSMSVSKETVIECGSLPPVKESSSKLITTSDSSVSPLHTLTDTPPDNLTASPLTGTPPHTLTDSPSHTLQKTIPSLTVSTISLVPGPSLTHDKPTSSPFTSSQKSPTLTPVYTIPPEVEVVDVRAGKSPSLGRKIKMGTSPRLGSTGSSSMLSLTSTGSASSGQRHSMSTFSVGSSTSVPEQQTQVPMETESPYTVLRAITRVRDSESKSRHLSRDSMASYTGSVISYVLTQEAIPRSKDIDPDGYCRVSSTGIDDFCSLSEPKMPVKRFPSPLRVKSETRSSQIPDSLKQRALPPTPDQVFDTTTTTKTHNPLKKTQGVFTLPLRRQKSPLIVSSEVPKDESCLDSDIKRVSATLPLHEPMPETLPVGSSLTLPSRNQKLVLKSITQSAAPCPYQRLESTRSRSSASSACLSPTTPPPLPPRTLIDPDRVVDFSAVIKGVKGDGGVSGEGDSVEATAVCLSCGREIRGEPYYICVLNSEDGSVADAASHTSDTVNTNAIDTANTNAINTVNTNAIDAINATEDETTSDTGPAQSIPTDGSPASPASLHSAQSVTPSSTHSTQFRISVSTEPPCSPISPVSTERPDGETTEAAAATVRSGSLSDTNRQTVEPVTDVEGAVTSTGGSLEDDEEVRPKPSSFGASESDVEGVYSVLEPGSAICMACIKKEGPIYHELEPGEIEEILAGIAAAPPIPPRVRPPKPRDPVYERIDSVRQTMHRKLTLKLSASSQVVTRVSVDGAYIIRASKPRSLRLRRDGSSTDYEHVSSIDTPSSPHYHKASEIHQLTEPYLPSQVDPAKHTKCKPHPPPLSSLQGGDSSNHDYESLPGSFEGRPLGVSLRGLGKRKGSHDYAFIGPAPSMESLAESPDSPPFVPEGANRATLMRIDSQGYASVLITDHTDDTELDCLKSGESQCSIHSSRSKERIHCPPGPPPPGQPLFPPGQLLSQASDYEVPVHVAPANVSESEENISVTMSPRLSRQRAVISESEDDKKVSGSGSHVEEEMITTQTLSVDPVDHSGRYDKLLPPPANEVVPEVLLINNTASTTGNQDSDTAFERKASIESAMERNSEMDNEDVFDSGIENCIDTQDYSSPQSRLGESTAALDPKPCARPISLGESTVAGGNNEPLRPRAMTVHSTKLKDITDGQTGQEKANSRSKSASCDSTGLHIILNQHSGVTV